MHNHSNSWLSGIYYPEGDKDFKILFLDSNTEWFKDIPIEYNVYNEAAREFTINENMLIIFPSSMRHQILPNASKKIDILLLLISCLKVNLIIQEIVKLI